MKLYSVTYYEGGEVYAVTVEASDMVDAIYASGACADQVVCCCCIEGVNKGGYVVR